MLFWNCMCVNRIGLKEVFFVNYWTAEQKHNKTEKEIVKTWFETGLDTEWKLPLLPKRKKYKFYSQWLCTL